VIGMIKLTTASPFANADTAARKLVEIASGVEPGQDGRIYIERVNAPFLAAAAKTSAPESNVPSLSAGCGCTRAGPT